MWPAPPSLATAAIAASTVTRISTVPKSIALQSEHVAEAAAPNDGPEPAGAPPRPDRAADLHAAGGRRRRLSGGPSRLRVGFRDLLTDESIGSANQWSTSP